MARSIDDIIATRQQDGTFGPHDPEAAASSPSQEMQPEQTVETPSTKPDDQAEDAAAQPPADAGGEIGQPQSQPPVEGTQPASVGSDPENDPKHWTYAAYKDEKAKRQAAEQRAAQVEAALRQREQALAQLQPPPETEPRPDLFSDPEAYEAYRDAKEDARLRNLQANMSMELAKVKHGEEKVTEAFNAVIDAANKGDPRFAQVVVNSPNPGETLLQVHAHMVKQQEIGGDIDGYIERKVAERLAAIERGETTGQPQPQRPQPGAMPSNMAGMRSVGARTGPAWTGPAPVEDIIAQRQAARANRGR